MKRKIKVAPSILAGDFGCLAEEAKIIEVRPKRILPHLKQGKIIIVAGFQGVSFKGEITTLGRGGSDTSAVALAVALKAEKVEFYKDVPGICTADPKKDPEAYCIPYLDHEQALEITLKGAKVLHSRCIDLARKNNMPLHVLPFDGWNRGECKGTLIGSRNSPFTPCYEMAPLCPM